MSWDWDFDSWFSLPDLSGIDWDATESSTANWTYDFGTFNNAFTTAGPRPTTIEPDRAPTYFLGTKFSYAIIFTTLILAAVAMVLNMGVMLFHFRKIRSSIISFMYFILSFSDFCTGFSALLHSLIFITIHVVREDLTYSVYWLLIPAYFITVVAFKVSAFVSMIIAVLRTFNVVFPFKEIRKGFVILALGLCALFWMIVFSADIGTLLYYQLGTLKQHKDNFKIHESLISYYFYIPGRVIWLEMIFGILIYMKISACAMEMMYTALPFFLCAFVTLVATAIQLKVLIFPSASLSEECDSVRKDKKKEMKAVTTTIALISLFFIVCASCSLYFPVHHACINPTDEISLKLTYAIGYLPYFVNAAANPLILFIRIGSYRNHVVRRFTMARRGTVGTSDYDTEMTTVSGARPSIAGRPSVASRSPSVASRSPSIATARRLPSVSGRPSVGTAAAPLPAIARNPPNVPPPLQAIRDDSVIAKAENTINYQPAPQEPRLNSEDV